MKHWWLAVARRVAGERRDNAAELMSLGKDDREGDAGESLSPKEGKR